MLDNVVPDLDAAEIYWAAGFWDGEGSAWGDPTRTGPRLGIGQNHRGPLERFARAVAGGNITGPYERKSAEFRDGYKRSPRYKWQAGSAAETLRIMELLRPLVCEVKREQFDRVFGGNRQLALVGDVR